MVYAFFIAGKYFSCKRCSWRTDAINNLTVENLTVTGDGRGNRRINAGLARRFYSSSASYNIDNIYSGEISGFDTLNYYLPDSVKDSDTILTLTDGAKKI